MPVAVRRTARDLRAAVLAHTTAALLAAALVGGVLEALRVLDEPDRLLLALGVECVACVAIALRYRAPAAAIALALGATVAAASLERAWGLFLYVAYFTPCVVGFALGRRGASRGDVPGVAALLAAGLAPRVLDHYDDTLGSFLANGISLGLAPFLLGRFLADRERLHGSLRARRAEIEAGRARAADRAVRRERDRIAAELHDVIAHALSGMVVQAAAARASVHPRPQQAGAALAAVEATGREALAEVRGLLGVLRSDDDVAERLPQPGLEALPALAARARRAGLDVVVRAHDDVGALPAGADLLAYRVVQDALGAAREPGGAGRAEVDVRRAGDRLRIEVRDDGPAPRVVAGARERVRVLGGDLATRRTEDGDHLVRVDLRLEGAA